MSDSNYPADHPDHPEHPDLLQLLAGARGALPAPEQAELERHLARCPQCRLELLRFQRFETAEHDEETLREAGWEKAEPALRTWQDRPAAVPMPPRPVRRRRRREFLPWIPVAAAAVLALVILQPWVSAPPVGPGTDTAGQESRLPASQLPPAEVMRGGGAELPVGLTLLDPEGLVLEPPREFTWQVTPRPGQDLPESYTLEVFTAELESIFRREGISLVAAAGDTQRFLATDELLGMLDPGETYLWNVRAFRDLLLVGESASGWFMVEMVDSP